MEQLQKLKLNSITSFVTTVVIILSGFIIPRLILLYFGSETNGIIASVRQFLSVITFLDLGVGSVIESSLYKPLASGNNEQVSLVLSSAKKYFRKISYVLVLYVLALLVFYPLIVDHSLSSFSIGFLIISLSLNIFARYYFGIINEFLLNADQKSYIQLGSEVLVVIINLIVTVILIMQGVSIQMVMLSTSLIYLLRPVHLTYYVRTHYDLSFNLEVKEDPIEQKWSGMAQHIAWTIQVGADVIILTIFSTLENVSIYSIYNMVIQGVISITMSFMNGINSFFGNLLANKEIELLNYYFDIVEWIIHTGAVFIFGMTAILLTPFVMIYTSGVYDVNYYAPMFSLVFVIAQAIYSIRTPYQIIVFSAGHFRQTQLSSFIEVLINIVVSFALIQRFELVGVAVGTLLSMIYRTFYLANYLSNNILNRSIRIFIKHLLVDVITFGLIFFTGIHLERTIPIDNIVSWLYFAVILGVISILWMGLINLIFYRHIMKILIRKLIKKV